MTVTIGRAALNDLYDLSVRGDRMSFLVDIDFDDVHEMKAVRQQLAGLVGNIDDPVIPFAWSEDSSLDGYYRPVSVAVGSSEVMLSSGFVPEVQVELERVSSFGNPWFEVTAQSVERVNTWSVSGPSGVFAAFQAPSADVEFELDTPVRALAAPSSVTLDTGDAMKIYKATAPMALTSFRFSCSPAKFYAGSCVIEQKLGSSWYPVVGRQVRIAAGTPWRLSNGLVRITSVDGATGSKVEVFNGTQWESQSIQHCYNSGPTLVRGGYIGQAPRAGSTVSVAILRNASEQVVVRLAGSDEVITWSIQRGAFHVVLRANPTANAGLVYSSDTGMSSFTGGLRRTSADASGNGLAFISPSDAPLVWDATLGGWAPTYLSPMAVALSIDLATSGAAETRRDEFFAPALLSQRMVTR